MGPSAQGGGAQRWGHSVDLGASLCTCDESELDSDLKVSRFEEAFNEKNTISYELRPGNESYDDGRAMVQYGLEGRGAAAKGYLCVAGDFPSQSL